MKKFILKILKYSFVILVVTNLIAFASLYFLNKGSFYKPQFLENSILKSDFDYIIIGSSVGLTGLDSNLINKNQNAIGINLCMDGTFLNSNYLMLAHFLALHKKTKHCILAVSAADLENANPSLNLNDYRFLPNIDQSYIKAYFEKNETSFVNFLAISKYFPAIAVGYYNSEIFFPAVVAAAKPNYHNKFDNNGNFAYHGNSVFEKRKMISKTIILSNPYLKMIAQLCQKNNIKLIVYLPPSYQRSIKIVDKNYNFLNFSDKINQKNCFYDPIHLNEKGRYLATENLIKAINLK